MRPRSRAGAVVIGAALAVALALGACGGDDEPTSAEGDDAALVSLEEDTVAIEKLMVEYGAAVGAESCDFFSADFLAEQGGLESCRRDNAEAAAVVFTVDDVSVDGDTASATISLPEGGRASIYALIREGEPADAYDGWKLSGFPERAPAGGEAPAEDETTAPAPAEDTPAPPDDEALIRELLANVAADPGPGSCQYFSSDFLSSIGGLEKCQRRVPQGSPQEITVRSIELSGDDASVEATRTGAAADGPLTYLLVREEGDWKLDATEGGLPE